MGIRRSFKDVPDSTGFSLVSVGKHPARMHVDAYQHDAAGNFATNGDGEKLYWATRNGDEMWKLRLVVDSGPHRGRYIFDNLVFSAAAMKRVKLICSRLGLDVSHELDLTPALIRGRSCYVTVEAEEYEDQEGITKRRNVVPFAGYECAEGAPAAPSTAAGNTTGAEDDSEEDLPF